MNDWININEKVPERETAVLVYVPSRSIFYIKNICIHIGVLCGNCILKYGKPCNRWRLLPFSYDYDHEIRFDCITHWMPLPNMPENKNE
jgi:hypothetical protein